MKKLSLLSIALIGAMATPAFADEPAANPAQAAPAAKLSDAEVQAKLDGIKIPRVSFSKVPLSQVLVTMEELSNYYDSDGVGIKIKLEGKGDPKVNITLRNLSLRRVLTFISESVGYSLRVSNGMVVISLGKPSEPMQTEIIPLKRAEVIRLTGGGGNGGHAVSDPFAAPAAASGAGYHARAGISFAAMGGSAPAFNTESYDVIEDNVFRSPLAAPLSTFSIDVDTASYSNVRRLIDQGRMPPPDAVRVEEFINYFPYAYEAPSIKPGADPKETDITKLTEQPFAVNAEVGPAPWAEGHKLVKIGLKGYEVDWSKRPPCNLVFLLDVSGSMDSPKKLPLVVKSLSKLVSKLDERDRVAIVVYAGASGLALPSTTGNNQETIMHALEQLHAGGSTNGGQGITLAYAQAKKHFIEDGVNRVILCTDGDFNVGVTDRGELTTLVEEHAKDGVYLTALGFGGGNFKDDMLETLSNKGNGNYAYIDSDQEARKVFSREAGGSMITIAKDVKIQVEFNPKLVQAYRLIGYENRKLKDEDFNNDKVDAGELGSGHTVTALYEIVPPGVKIDLPKVDDLKYQTNTAPAGPDDELMTVKLRYKWPKDDESQLLSVVIPASSADFAACSDDFRFATAVAGWGMLLRDSEFKGDVTMDWVEQTASNAFGDDPGGFRDNFLELVEKSREVKANTPDKKGS